MNQILRLLTCIISFVGFTAANAQTTVTITTTKTPCTFNTCSIIPAGVKNDGDMITINSAANRGWTKFDLLSIPTGAHKTICKIN